MKRILLPLVLAFVATANTWAEDDYDFAEINGIWYDLNLDKKIAEATDLSEDITGSIAIPAFVTYNGTTYTVVGINGFSTESLTSITIPYTVRYIIDDGIEGYFPKYESLTDIIVDEANPNYSSLNGVLYNKNKSELLYCPAGKSGSYTIPNSVTKIGCYAFEECSGLTSVTIPNSVKCIDDNAFFRCSGLTSVTISNGVTNIGYAAFSGCSGLTSVTIPNSVESIGYAAFSGCSGLTSVTIPNSVESIEDAAFSDCTSLPVVDNVRYADNYLVEAVDKDCIYVNIKDGTKWIGDRAFDGCYSLRYIVIPNSVTSIGSYAFGGCYSLPVVDGLRYADTYLVGPDINSMTSPDVVIKEGTKWIGNDAFYYQGITSVSIPNSVTRIGSNAFADCCNLTSITIPNSVKEIEGGAFFRCAGLTSVIIPNSVESIGGSAFADCPGLTNINIPYSVKSIGYGAFAHHMYESNLLSINVDSDNAFYCSRDGVLFNKDKTELVEFPGGKKGSYDIPGSVKSIADDAFYGCTGLTSVTIPNSVTSIGQYAFEGCSGLTSISIPSSVTTIGKYAFEYCDYLEDVYCYAVDVPKTHFDAFDNPEDAVLHVPYASLNEYRFSKPWIDFGSIVPLTDQELGIDTVNENEYENENKNTIYDLSGRRLNEAPEKGIYIQNGKKIMIK